MVTQVPTLSSLQLHMANFPLSYGNPGTPSPSPPLVQTSPIMMFNFNTIKNDMVKITNHRKTLKKPLIYLIDTPGVEYKQLVYHLDTVDHVVKENLKLKQAVQI